jgi:hypothetical protein
MFLSALWSKEPLSVKVASGLDNAKLEGWLVIGASVYWELLAYPHAAESFVDDFLADTNMSLRRAPAKLVFVAQQFANFFRIETMFAGNAD